MTCFQVGAVLAKSLFPIVGASGAVALRLALAALMLLALWRPWRMRLTARDLRTIGVYGLALGWMNFFFYLSIRSIPLGVAVALEFTGPLALAMAVSRRPIDFVWILMAAAGLCALLPLGGTSNALSSVGTGCALAAGVCWAVYIQFGRKAGASHGGAPVALGMLIGAITIVPIGIAEAGGRLLSPAVLPMAVAVAVLSSALPYSLEMFAMPRLPTRTVGVLMSLGAGVRRIVGPGVHGREADPAAVGRDRVHHGCIRRQCGDQPRRCPQPLPD